MKGLLSTLGTILGLVLVIIAIDQGVKGLVVEKLSPVGSHPLIAGIVDLTYRENRGVAFSMLNGLPVGVMVTLVLLVLAVFVALVFPHLRTRSGMAAAVLILGGALGNLIDRIFRKGVIDYINFHIWPVFNIADAAIVIGVGILIVTLFFAERGKTPSPGGERS